MYIPVIWIAYSRDLPIPVGYRSAEHVSIGFEGFRVRENFLRAVPILAIMRTPPLCLLPPILSFIWYFEITRALTSPGSRWVSVIIPIVNCSWCVGAFRDSFLYVARRPLILSVMIAILSLAPILGLTVSWPSALLTLKVSFSNWRVVLSGADPDAVSACFLFSFTCLCGGYSALGVRFTLFLRSGTP